MYVSHILVHDTCSIFRSTSESVDQYSTVGRSVGPRQQFLSPQPVSRSWNCPNPHYTSIGCRNWLLMRWQWYRLIYGEGKEGGVGEGWEEKEGRKGVSGKIGRGYTMKGVYEGCNLFIPVSEVSLELPGNYFLFQ